MQGYKLICLKIPLVSPLGLMEFLTKQGHFLPPHYHWVSPRVPLEHLRAALHAVVVACIWMPLYGEWFYIVANGG